jgi:heme/copper-type cytochrome/quinol oxidase subunit 2
MDVVLDMLLTQPIGLMSLFTILFIIGMAIYLVIWYRRKMNNPDE